MEQIVSNKAFKSQRTFEGFIAYNLLEL